MDLESAIFWQKVPTHIIGMKVVRLSFLGYELGLMIKLYLKEDYPNSYIFHTYVTLFDTHYCL